MIIIAIILILLLIIIYLLINNNNILTVSEKNPVKKITIKKYNRRPVDAVREYDYKKIGDPLEEPTRRVPRHWIPPTYFKYNTDIPTRGYPDNFSQFGILVKKERKKAKTYKNNEDTDNNVLRLYGRQEYPGSDKYEYYTAINSGYDQIKVPLDIKNRELYNDDIVYIRELGNEYKVKLHRYDAPKYYPDIL